MDDPRGADPRGISGYILPNNSEFCEFQVKKQPQIIKPKPENPPKLMKITNYPPNGEHISASLDEPTTDIPETMTK